MMKRLLMLLLLVCLISPVMAGYTIGSTYYSDGKQFNVTANAATSDLTAYQVMINLSNSTGASTSTTLYTNGTTNLDWSDVVFTDGSNTQIPFWIENNTYTSTGATAWVKVPTISTSGSMVRVYYGNSSKSASEGNGYATFNLFDDFSSSTLNTTQFGYTGAPAISNGYLILTGLANNRVQSVSTFGYNYSLVSRFSMGYTSYASVGITDYATAAGLMFYGYYPTNSKYNVLQRTGEGTGTNADIGTSYTGNHVWSLSRSNSAGRYSIDGSTISTLTGTFPSGSYPVLMNAQDVSNNVTVDWIGVRQYRYPEPTFSIFESIPSGATAPIASFTDLPNPSVVNTSVSFADTSTNTPTAWDWGWGDGTANSTTQNPTHTYTAIGTYQVFLNVSNSYGFNSTVKYHTVINASGINQQDLELDPQFTMTMHITDSSTGAPIPVVTVTDSNAQVYTTANGTAYFTEPYSTVVFYLVAEGYASKSMSYIMDENRDVTVQLSAASTINNYAVTYPPKDVKFHTQTFAGSKITGVNVTATPYSTSLGSYTYVASLFGYNLDTTPLANLTLTGTTDSNGDITFAMMSDTQYSITASKTGYTFTSFVVTPHDDNYIINADGATNLFQSNGSSPAAEVTYAATSTRINASVAVINISYTDLAGATTGGKITLYRGNGT